MAKMYNSSSQNKNVCSVCQISEGLRNVINQEKEEPPLTGEVREACTASADRVANAILGEVLCDADVRQVGHYPKVNFQL